MVKQSGGGILKVILSLFLGFILGIVGTVGGVIGLGYYLGTQVKIKDAVTTVEDLAGFDIDYSSYLSAPYADNTLEYLFKGVYGAVTEIIDGKGTLNTLAEISPYVKTLIIGTEDQPSLLNSYLEFFESYGLKIDSNALMDKYLVKKDLNDYNEDYLVDYLLDKVYAIPVGGLFNVEPTAENNLIIRIFYGEKDLDYTIDENNKIQPIEGREATLTIGDMVNEGLNIDVKNEPIESFLNLKPSKNPSVLMYTLAYGAEYKYTANMEKDIVEMNQVWYTYENNTFYDAENVAVQLTAKTEVSPTSYLLKFTDGSEQLVTLNALDNKYYATTNDDNQDPILYKKLTINDLSNEGEDILNSLTLLEVLHLDGNTHPILLSIACGIKNIDYTVDPSTKEITMLEGKKACTIGDLQNSSKTKNIIKNIRLVDVISYEDTEKPVAENSLLMYVLYGKKDIHYTLEGTNLDNLQMLKRRIAKTEEDDYYNEYGELNQQYGTWFTNQGYTLVNDDSLGTIKTKDGKEATLYYIKDADGEFVYFEPTTVGSLANKNSVFNNITNRLTLGELLGVETLNSNDVLKYLKDETLDDLPTALENLQFADVFEQQAFLTCESLDSYNEGDYYSGTTYSIQPDEFGKKYYEDANGVKVYEGQTIDRSGNAVFGKDRKFRKDSKWKYLLADPSSKYAHLPLEDRPAIDCTLLKMDDIIENMTTNMQTATFQQLHDDNLLKMDCDTKVKTTLVVDYCETNGHTDLSLYAKAKSAKDNGEDLIIGDLTVEEVGNYLQILTNIVNSY